eukprot:GDKI01006798.1.p1 GENE.GDKI01006798.1~~GDKI01006798.1.p1  ORF type:complete len:108 (-),score=27.17 GDKI01006798.1:259-582(-)
MIACVCVCVKNVCLGREKERDRKIMLAAARSVRAFASLYIMHGKYMRARRHIHARCMRTRARAVCLFVCFHSENIHAFMHVHFMHAYTRTCICMYMYAFTDTNRQTD